MPRFTVEFDCIDEQQKRSLLDGLYEKYGVGLATKEAPTIISWLNDRIPIEEDEYLKDFGQDKEDAATQKWLDEG